jgi:uncharacterized cupin superfamily protein
VFEGTYQRESPETGLRGSMLGRAAGARELGASVYELDPGSTGMNLHAHYGNEEMFVVLEGSPTLRTPSGEEQLRRGDVVACPRGREGAHTIINSSAASALVLAVSTANTPDVVVYPETDSIGVATRNPFETVPEGGDEGVVGMFDAADNKRPRR